VTETLTGKVIVVTGAGSGIGRAIAEHCLRAGAQVVLGDIDLGRVETVRKAMAGEGLAEQAIAVAADITDPVQVAALMDAGASRFGRLDGVVANAGLFGARCPMLTVSPEAWNGSLSINLSGAFYTLQAAARVLVAQGQGGSLVATGSSQGVRGPSGNIAYTVAKAGVHALVKAMAIELAPERVRVNAIVPGLTITPTTSAQPGYLEQVAPRLPLGSAVQPEELAALAGFLLGDAAPHMTGSLIPLDSGVTAA